MRFYNQQGELAASPHSRTYGEELATLLSAFDCLLNGSKALYASSELTTGKRLYDLMLETGARTAEELRAQLGEEGYRCRLWEPNLAEALDFARQVRARHGRELVLTPAPFVALGWSQPEYLGLWETVIRTRVETLFFGSGWEYSNGCAFELCVAWDAGIPARDADGVPISRELGSERISAAAAELEGHGFDASELRASLVRLSAAGSYKPGRQPTSRAPLEVATACLQAQRSH
jgi:hypothetical protein